MNVYRCISKWQAVRNALSPTITLGFVPTMGHLHLGHASLIRRSLEENEQTIVSIFVNPTQFNQGSDYANYPRTLDKDLSLLRSLGITHCLLPEKENMYPDEYAFQLQETVLSKRMEGAFRPSHFTGMLTIVMKLLQLTRPHRVYFGEKDYQQYILISEMVKAFFMGVQVVVCPTVREASGLALSSRNSRLNREQKQRAIEFAQIFHQQQSSAEIYEMLCQAGFRVDYVEEHENRRFVAAWVDDIRLIDNYVINGDLIESA